MFLGLVCIGIFVANSRNEVNQFSIYILGKQKPLNYFTGLFFHFLQKFSPNIYCTNNA